jgi:polar amino acid transport system substrate-binding protein
MSWTRLRAAVVAAALAVVAAIGPTPSMAAPLRLVTDQWVPYEDLSDAAAPGFSTEVLRGVFASMKQEVSFEEFPWARAAQMVFRGERDGIFTAFYSEERARCCHFPTEPLARDKWILFVRTADVGQLRFASFDDLLGHDIAVLRGASISPEFWDFARRHQRVVETASDEANFRMLEAGRVQYVIASFVNGMRLIASLADSSRRRRSRRSTASTSRTPRRRRSGDGQPGWASLLRIPLGIGECHPPPSAR